MPNKAALLKQIEGLPEEFTIEELIDRLVFMEKVEKGLNQSSSGDVSPEAELDNEIRKWFA
jgi:hypothetical protein